jgi:hypothetical protein
MDTLSRLSTPHRYVASGTLSLMFLGIALTVSVLEPENQIVCSDLI